MSTDWLAILLSGLLSLIISHIYYWVSTRGAERHHASQLQTTGKRHTEQMQRMASQHAEELLVLRTTLLAVEKDSGVQAARDGEGKLTGGLHHDGQFIAPPSISPSAIANDLPRDTLDDAAVQDPVGA